MSKHHVGRLLVAIMLLAVPLATSNGASADSPSDSSPPPCWVKDRSTGVTGSDLEAAIANAAPGALLSVRGRCVGGFDFGKDITLVGPATLDGGHCPDDFGPGCFGEPVIYVGEGNVKLKKLVITGGYSTVEGGGITNHGNLTLSSTVVRGNLAEDGGGGILNEGKLTMNWSSVVADNDILYGRGGGILNHGTLIMNAWARVEGNYGTFGGGIYNDGTVILNRAATVTANSNGGLFNDGGNVHFSPRWRGTLCGNTPESWPTC